MVSLCVYALCGLKEYDEEEEEEEEILFGKKGFHNLGIDIPYILEKLTKNDNYKIKENYIRHIHN